MLDFKNTKYWEVLQYRHAELDSASQHLKQSLVLRFRLKAGMTELELFSHELRLDFTRRDKTKNEQNPMI
jgi:hypothetical protein